MKPLLVLLILITPVSCFGKALGAFEVNGVVVSERVFNNLWQEANAQHAVSREDYQSKLINSLLLAEHATKHYPLLLSQTNVGYDPILTQRLQVNRLLLKWFKFDAEKRLKAANESIHFMLTEQALTEAIGKPSLLGYELNQRQRKKAQNVVVANFTLDDSSVQLITLAELYDEQSVQGRMAFHQGDVKHVKKFVYDRFFMQWHRVQSVKRDDFGASDLQAIDAIVQARFVEPALMLKLGAVTSEHGNNEGLEPFKSKVTAAQINTFYVTNREDFKYISHAKARLLTFDKEQDARQAYTALQSEKDWQNMALKLGQSGWFAGNKDGWLQVKPDNNWLESLAFTFPVGERNPPIRSPQGQWILVRVEQQRQDFYPSNSDTVVFQATFALAKAHARVAFDDLKQQLRSEASIKYHEQ